MSQSLAAPEDYAEVMVLGEGWVNNLVSTKESGLRGA